MSDEHEAARQAVDNYALAEAMIKFGGKFRRAARAAAPPRRPGRTRARLLAAFPDYVDKYRALAATRAATKGAPEP